MLSSTLRSSPLLLFSGLVPGALSGIAIARVTRHRVHDARGPIVGGSVVAAMLVPLSTLTPTLLWSAAARGGVDVRLFLETIFAGGAEGAIIAAPVGFVFGVLHALVRQRLDASRAYGCSALERLWMRFGGVLTAIGAIVLVLARAFPTDEPNDLLVALGAGTLVFGLGAALRGLVRARLRRRLVRLARLGKLAGWAVVAASDVVDARELPALFGRDGTEVLVRRELHARGPFRSGEAMLPIARC